MPVFIAILVHNSIIVGLFIFILLFLYPLDCLRFLTTTQFLFEESFKMNIQIINYSFIRKILIILTGSLYKNGVKEKRLEKRLLRLSKKKESGNTDVYRASWAYLLRRTFGAEGFECPRCCGVMELRMGQVFGAMAQRIFLSLSGNGRAPPME